MHKRNYQTWLIVAIVFVVAIISLSGCSSDDATPESATTPTEDSPEISVHYYVVSETSADGAIPIGCDQFAVPQDVDVAYTGQPQRDVRAALEALFSAESDSYTNYWNGATITELTIGGGGMRLQLIGGYQPTGVCADAAAEAQIVLAVFNNSDAPAAFITLNGTNMKQVFDGSGLVEAGATYTRDNVPVVTGD